MTDTSSPSAPSVYHEGRPQVDLSRFGGVRPDRCGGGHAGADHAEHTVSSAAAGGRAGVDAPRALLEQYRDYRRYDPEVCAADPLGSVYEVVLLTPDLAQYCRFGRDDPGLKLFRDGIYAADVASLSQACRIIREWTGRYVHLVEERHGELTRWVVRPSPVL